MLITEQILLRAQYDIVFEVVSFSFSFQVFIILPFVILSTSLSS